MAKASIATISGTFLAPGVSLNGRLYTADNIKDAITRMQARLSDGAGVPVSMYDSHYEDSVLQTIGKVTAVQQMPDGSGRFTADVPDTAAGHDLATLTSNGYLRNVSIAAYWVGDMEEREVDGEWITTAPGLDVRRIDYVGDPGVPQAVIDSVVLSEAAAGTWRDAFTTEAAHVSKGFRPAYADPGFREDGRPRLPLATPKQIEDAWKALGEDSDYPPADLARARARVRAAAAVEGLELGEIRRGNRSGMEIVRAVEQPATPPTCKEDLSQLVALDPDQDGDIDGYACPTCGSVRPNTDDATNPDGDGVELQSRKETPMTEAVEETAATEAKADEEPALTESEQRIVDALAAKLAPKETPAKEAKPDDTEATATETKTPSEDELIDKITSKLRQEILDAGLLPGRKGVVRKTGAEGIDRSKLTPDERFALARAAMSEHVLPTALVAQSAGIQTSE